MTAGEIRGVAFKGYPKLSNVTFDEGMKFADCAFADTLHAAELTAVTVPSMFTGTSGATQDGTCSDAAPPVCRKC